MATLVELAGRTLAVELTGAGAAQPTEGGLLLPPGRVAVLHGMGDALFYRHGWNSWSPCGWRRLSEPPLRIANPRRLVTADDPPWDDPHRHHSSAVAALSDEHGQVLLLGALGLDVPRLVADRDALVGWYESGSAEWFLAYGAEEQVFADYARLLSERFGRRHRRAGNVWCSWYAYYEGVSEAYLVKDIDDLRDLPFDVVQIDDGWEEAVGDWHPNAKFPSGMADLARRTADAGFTPGLWVAPFIAVPQSRLARERPELLLRDASGELAIAGYNWGGPYFALDLSRSDAREYVARTIERVVHDWGYRYLKLDFINAAAAPGVRPEGYGREQAYRDGLQIIRDVAGDDVYLLGSGGMLLPSLGILDGLRSGPDVAPMWDNYASDDPSDAMARNAVVNAVHRLWQARLLEIDPDVIYFRSRLSLLSEEQAALLRDLADICGFRAVSDPPHWLSATEIEAMSSYLRRRPEVRRLDRYLYTVDGRKVDFSPAIHGVGQLYPIS